MKELILHSLRMRKVNTLTLLISIALSTCLCLVLGLTYCGVTKGVELSETRSGCDMMVIPLQARTVITDTQLLFAGAPAPIYMNKDVVDTVAKVDGVEKASPQFFCQTLDAGCCSLGAAIRLIGIDFESDFVVTPLLEEKLTGLGDHELIAGGNVPNAEVGMVMMILGENYTVKAVLPDTGGELDDCIVIDINRARELAYKMPDYDEVFSQVGNPEDLISAVVIDASSEEAKYNAACFEIRKISGIALVENSDVLDSALNQLKSVFVLLGVGTLVMVVVTLLQLFARFYSCVWERKAELALYRAVGADTNALRIMIGGEIGVLVLAGTVLGMVLGFIGQYMLQKLLIQSMEFPFTALGIGGTSILCVGILFAFILVALLAILWPLKQISRIDPSLAMQQGDID